MSAPTPTPAPVRRRGLLLLVLVLALGLLMGASGMVLVHHLGWGPPEPGRISRRPPPRVEGPPPELALRHLTRALELDEEQRRDVARILETRRDEIDALMREAHEEIREILRPDQQEALDALHERHEHRAPHRGPRHPPPRD